MGRSMLLGIVLCLATFSSLRDDLSSAFAAVTAPGMFTYWGTTTMSTYDHIGVSVWFDHEEGLLYTYGGSAYTTPGWANSRLSVLNMTSTNSTSGAFLPTWTLLFGDSLSLPSYPENAGDPASAGIWPGERDSSATAIDKISSPGDTLLWIYGGWGYDNSQGAQVLEDLWYYSVKNGTWRFMGGRKFAEWRRTTVPTGYPGPRAFSHMFFDSSTMRLLIFGGAGLPAGAYSVGTLPTPEYYAVYAFDMMNLTWSAIDNTTTHPDALLVDPVAFRDGDTIYMTSSSSTTMPRYHISNNSWSELTPRDGFIPNRYRATQVHRDPRSRSVFMWGGIPTGGDFTSTLHRFSFDTETWELVVDPPALTNFDPLPPIGVASPNVKPDKPNRGAAALLNGRLFLVGGVYYMDPRLFTYNLLCAPGQVVNEYGDCVSCPASTFAFSGTQCQPCPSGTFGNRTELSSCYPCPDGYSSTEGSESCVQCPSGTFSNRNVAGICTACAAGYAPNNAASDCEICPAGTFALPTNASCIPCPPGRTAAPGQSSCSPCSALNLYSNASTAFICSSCPAGWISSGDRASCVPCPSGYYQPLESAPLCVICPEGSSSAIGSSSCSPCSAGTYSSDATNGLCVSCPEGYAPSTSRSYCLSTSGLPPTPFSAPSSQTGQSAPQTGSDLSGGNQASNVNTATNVAAIVLGVLLFVALGAIGFLVFKLRAASASFISGSNNL